MVYALQQTQDLQQRRRVERQDGVVFQYQGGFVAVGNLLPHLVVTHETGHFGDFDGALPGKRVGLKKRIRNVSRSLRIDEQCIQVQVRCLLGLKLPALQC